MREAYNVTYYQLEQSHSSLHQPNRCPGHISIQIEASVTRVGSNTSTSSIRSAHWSITSGPQSITACVCVCVCVCVETSVVQA